jgi:hypothetical protein
MLAIGISEILRSRESGHYKSRNSEIRSGPFIRLGTWRRSEESRRSEFRESRGRGIQDNRSREPREFIWTVHPFGTRVRNPQRVGIFGIGKSEFLRSKELGHHKSRNPDEIRAARL